jgi:hypothetical protein
VLSSTTALNNAAPSSVIDVRYYRHRYYRNYYGPGIALGALGAVAGAAAYGNGYYGNQGYYGRGYYGGGPYYGSGGPYYGGGPTTGISDKPRMATNRKFPEHSRLHDRSLSFGTNVRLGAYADDRRCMAPQ